MTAWEKPTFVEIDMSAEIGGYQGDEPGRPDHGPDFPEYAVPNGTAAKPSAD
jgi:coenzyme PQQ precursor peptide PqqA